MNLSLICFQDELANVATMDCHSSRNEALCEKLGQDYGTYFYQPGKIQKGEGLVRRSNMHKVKTILKQSYIKSPMCVNIRA